MKQAKETSHCPGCDLSGADFENFNPAKAAATGDAVKCDFGGADLSGARLANVNMQKDSRYTDFVASVKFAGTDFRKADLSRSWTGSPGDIDTFEGANLDGADLCVYFFNTNLTGATLRDATIDVMEESYSYNAREPMGTSKKVNRSIFETDDQTFLPGAIFVGVDFINADLSGAEFRGPAAYRAQAELLAILSQATLGNTTLPDVTKSNRDCK